jgi:chromosome segregation ATPase
MRRCRFIVLAVWLLMAQPLWAQQRERQDERQRPDPRQLLNERMMQALRVSADEWTVLQPRVEKVIALQTNIGQPAPGLANMMGRRFRGLIQADAGAEVRQSLAALEQALANSNSTQEDIRAALEAARKARAEAQQQLSKARQELVALLTTRQEATLFQLGVLE